MYYHLAWFYAPDQPKAIEIKLKKKIHGNFSVNKNSFRYSIRLTTHTTQFTIIRKRFGIPSVESEAACGAVYCIVAIANLLGVRYYDVAKKKNKTDSMNH